MFIFDDAMNAFFNTAAAGMLAAVKKLWDSVVNLSYGLLGVTPQSFQGGTPWGIIESIYPYFIAIGTSLVGLFFVMGFCTESVNIREDMRLEKIIKMFLKLILAEGLITNGLAIMKKVFIAVANMTGLVKQGYPTKPMMIINEEWLETLGDGNGMLNFCLLMLVLIFAFVAGGVLLYMVYSRFFKLYMIIPLAPIALSAAAGSGGINHTASAWVRTFFAYSLEIVVIALALALSGSIVSGSSIFENASGTLGAVLAIGNIAFTMLITAGSVKGAENVIRKALGL